MSLKKNLVDSRDANCQKACKNDPLSALKNDPLWKRDNVKKEEKLYLLPINPIVR